MDAIVKICRFCYGDRKLNGSHMPTFGSWTYAVDRQATFDAYARVALGGADECECGPCRNFRLVRGEIYPREFLDLLDTLGVDWSKEGEVWETGSADTNFMYGGWFHFVGRVTAGPSENEHIELAPGFTISFGDGRAPCILEPEKALLATVQFYCTNPPWRLAEPYPGAAP